MTVTPAELEALEALLKKATPRPWRWFTDQCEGALVQDRTKDSMRFLVGGNGQGLAHSHGYTVGLNTTEDVANADLIVAAVNALPRLLAALRARDAAVVAREAARRACQEIAGNPVLLTGDAVDAIVDRAATGALAALKPGGGA